MTISKQITPVKLTPEQERRWGDVKRMLQFQAPGFMHYYNSLLNHDNKGLPLFVDDKKLCPRAWTDEVNIVVNREWFFNEVKSLPERVFVIGHEIIHNMRSDPTIWAAYRNGNGVPQKDGTTREFDENTMQTSGDYTANALLVESGIGKPLEDIYYDPKVATGADSTLDVYGKRYKKKRPGRDNGGAEQQGSSGNNGMGPLDGNPSHDVQAPGASTNAPGPNAVNQTQKNAVLQQALTLQQGHGKLPQGMKRMFDEVIDPKVPWQEKVRALVLRKLGSDGRTWKEPDIAYITRDLYLPSKTGFGCGHLAIWGDTSGSRSDQDVADQVSEMHGIMEELQPEKVTVLWGDADIAQVDELETYEDLQDLDPKGGGGTDIDPILKWIADERVDIDMLICFTDGEFHCPPSEPPYPVLWVLNRPARMPWGDIVYVNSDHEEQA